MKDFSLMTPYELGETREYGAIDYIIEYIKKGNINEKRLAASALRKLVDKHKQKCNEAVFYLIENLKDMGPQVRQYTLKALMDLDLSIEELEKIREFRDKEDKSYNKRIAQEILVKYQVEEETIEDYLKAPKTYDSTEVYRKNKILANIYIKDIYAEAIFKNFVDYCYRNGYRTLGDFDKIDFTAISTMVFGLKKNIKLKYLSVLNNLNYIEKYDHIYIDTLNCIFRSREEELLKELNKYDLLNIEDKKVIACYSGEMNLRDEVKTQYREAAIYFIELLKKAADKEVIDKKTLEIFKKRYSINDKYYTLQSISKEYGIGREQAEEIINRLLHRVARRAFRMSKSKDFDDIALKPLYFLKNLLSFDNRTLIIERIVLFVFYGFPETHSKLAINLIVLMLYGKDKEWKRESIYASYNKFIDNLESSRQQKELSIEILERIQWMGSKKNLSKNQYIGIETIRTVRETLQRRGSYFYSKKLNKNIYYKTLIEKDFLLKLEQCMKVVFYASNNFKVGQYISDVFFVLEDGSAVIAMMPDGDENINLKDEDKEKALKKLCREKGLGFIS